MADVTKVKASDGTIYDINDVNDYTKDETDALLAGKADVGVSYTKAEDDALLADKANASDVTSELALKANVVDVYSKTEADNLLAGKADTGVSYTKAEDDALLADKANSADVYTITQTDGLLADKAGIDDSSTTATMATWSADKLNVEFQNRYTKTEDDALLADKADTADVYTKAEVDALLEGLGMGILDLANAVKLTATAYVTTKLGAVIGGTYGTGTSPCELLVNSNRYGTYDSYGRQHGVNIYGVPIGTELKLTVDNYDSYAAIWFVPYVERS